MPNDPAITSEELANLIVDALVDAGLVSRERFDDAVHVAAEEIDVRKVLGDYSREATPPDYFPKRSDNQPKER